MQIRHVVGQTVSEEAMLERLSTSILGNGAIEVRVLDVIGSEKFRIAV